MMGYECVGLHYHRLSQSFNKPVGFCLCDRICTLHSVHAYRQILAQLIVHVYIMVFTEFCNGYLRRGLTQNNKIWQDGIHLGG